MKSNTRMPNSEPNHLQYVEHYGKGDPLVFIHGSFASTATWKKYVEQLEAQYHCILLKLPGHCGLPAPNDHADPTIETELDILGAVVKALSDRPIHLIGHSYGGVVALAQALKGNIPIRKMTLFEPVAAWALGSHLSEVARHEINNFLEQYRNDVANNVPYACGQLIDFWTGKGAFEQLPDFIQDGMQALTDGNIRHWDICTTLETQLQDLEQCAIPTTVVCGTQSNPIAHTISENIQAAMPHCKNYFLDGASHFLVTTHVQECLDIILE